jgi:co-chaperonin GroES (HSP10)
MKTKVIPVGKRVLIKKKDADAYFQGTSIMIPESQRQEELKGYVIAIGKEVDEVKVGDCIQYADYALPTKMKHQGEDHLLIAAGDIFAVLVDIKV